jgi:hypothetical protein
LELGRLSIFLVKALWLQDWMHGRMNQNAGYPMIDLQDGWGLLSSDHHLHRHPTSQDKRVHTSHLSDSPSGIIVHAAG